MAVGSKEHHRRTYVFLVILKKIRDCEIYVSPVIIEMIL